MSEFDIVIIGSGMGGLVCGNILSRKGYRVCMLEKNRQIGGSLQVYARDKVVFDAGVHYVGGLDKGQNLYQIFKWLGIIDRLKLERMDIDGFDHIFLDGDSTEYKFAQGYPRFIQTLSSLFPGEEGAIQKYCDKIREACSLFPLYNLQRGGSIEEKAPAMTISAKEYIHSLTSNEKLRAVLAGNTILYAGYDDETPFHVHALILNSYIESSWKCLDGGNAIGHAMAANIRASGGLIRTSAKVESINSKEDKVVSVNLSNGETILTANIISNLHPAKTLELTKSDHIRRAYRERLTELKNTVSVFVLNIVFQQNSFPNTRHNYYCLDADHCWTMADYAEENWPLGYAIYFTGSTRSPDWAQGATIFTYMKFEDVEQWKDSFNTTSSKSDRSPDYLEFKKRKAERLLDKLEARFPGIRTSIHSYYSATPLSFRDYIGTDDGSLYGISRDFRDPYRSMISPRTRLSNLYLTGQNLNLHGILGSAISGLITSAAFLGTDDFIDDIRNA